MVMEYSVDVLKQIINSIAESILTLKVNMCS